MPPLQPLGLFGFSEQIPSDSPLWASVCCSWFGAVCNLPYRSVWTPLFPGHFGLSGSVREKLCVLFRMGLGEAPEWADSSPQTLTDTG